MNQRIKWMLIYSTVLSVALLITRITISERITFIFMIWNLFLAWIPFLITQKVLNKPSFKNSTLLFTLGFGAWLVFFPNAPYMLTDLFHLELRPYIPLWFDLALLLSFAWTAMLLAYLSLKDMFYFLSLRMKLRYAFPIMLFVIALSGYGIYLGRYGRFNSWEILTNPLELSETIFHTFIHPIRNRDVYYISGIMSAILFMFFGSLYALTQPLKSSENEH